MAKLIVYKYALTSRKDHVTGCLFKNKKSYGIVGSDSIEGDENFYDLHVVSNESLTFNDHPLIYDKFEFYKIVASSNSELNLPQIDFKTLNQFIDDPDSEIESVKIEFTNGFKSFDKIPDRYLVDNFSNYKWILKTFHKREIPFVPSEDRMHLGDSKVSVDHVSKTIENLSTDQKFEILRFLMQSEFFSKQYKVIQEFCNIASKVGDKFEHKHAHDCFCGEKPFDSNFKFDEELLEIMKDHLIN